MEMTSRTICSPTWHREYRERYLYKQQSPNTIPISLLALFGERVTMQFMSQSMGWADNIILAMAPLGIVTAIVAAIRVGGPSWLRAVIGRARENLAVSEAELMSSTSKEVCEVWNGQEVVRCMGLAPVVEFICLLQYTEDAQSESRTGPMIEVLELKEAIRRKYIMDLGKMSALILFLQRAQFQTLTTQQRSRRRIDLDKRTVFDK